MVLGVPAASLTAFLAAVLTIIIPMTIPTEVSTTLFVSTRAAVIAPRTICVTLTTRFTIVVPAAHTTTP
ncbi:hypothetical protein KB1_08710 [Cutibacterium modestum]|uniref:Uncharacterized protein n=1 Tax=Cutibacterium modestum TaxID=2559073 RepID=A0AAD1KPM9_9ACTN|nr:hypothetical protein KB1_08710 [Cutibacterium modestum]